MRRLSEERPILWRVLLLGTVNLVFLAKQSVEEAVDVGLAGSLAVDAAVVEAIVVVEVGLVTTLVDDATPAVVVVEAIVVVKVGLVTMLVEDATLLIVDVHVKEAILLIVDALAALCFSAKCCRRINCFLICLRNKVISAVLKLKSSLLLTRAISEVSKSFFEKGCLRSNIIANIHWITTSPHSVFPSC